MSRSSWPRHVHDDGPILLRFWVRHQRRHGYPPTVREAVDWSGWGYWRVARALSSMTRLGLMRARGRSPRTRVATLRGLRWACISEG